uniref:Uncharacterized protein n=1 Tax=Plectus sambesii TaxID=2011161 RepID=A0A914XTV0_9BILA
MTASVASLVYLNKVFEILTESREMKKTFIGIAKQTGYTASGAAIGGIVAGPAGAFVGAVFGAWAGYATAEDYQSMVNVVRTLSDDQKYRLEQKIQALVGSVSIEQFVTWLQTEGHRQLLLSVLGEAVKAA